jgi:hypothetical protein
MVKLSPPLHASSIREETDTIQLAAMSTADARILKV